MPVKLFRDRAAIAAVIAAMAIGLTLIISQPTGGGGRVGAGEPARTTYKAPRTVTYVSAIQTKEAEDKAAETVPVVYRADLTAPNQQAGKRAATFQAVEAIRADTASSAEQRVSKLQTVIPNLSEEEGRALLGLVGPDWEQVKAMTQSILELLQTRQIKQADLIDAERLVAAEIGEDVPNHIRTSVVLLGKKLLLPNYLIDDEATEAAKQRARDAVERVSYTINRNQVIAYRGQVLNEFDVERLGAAGLTRPTFSWQETAGVFLLILLFSVVLTVVAPRTAPPGAPRRRMIALLAGFAVAVTVAGILVPAQPILAYVFPLASIVLLLALFYGLTAAILAGVCYVALFSLAYGGSFELFFIHLAASLTAVLLAGRITNTLGFVKAGGIVGAVTFLGMMAFAMLGDSFDAGDIPKFAVSAALNGALTATFVFAGAAFLGGPMEIVTFLQLLELENPRQPLLRRLAHEAPNTYSHSLRIARLVEAGAEAIGADPLLARIQALYHDVGKLSAPEYFTENQEDGINPHEKQDPRESAEILRAHISEGLALAREHRVPEAVARAIPEHHGTFMMSYFLDKARKRDKAVPDDEFRYHGPKPQSRETALLLLADASEAASRSLKEPSKESLGQLIKQLINERVHDGQLEEAPLTTQDLRRIRQVFTDVLAADLHKRVSYPKRARGRKRQ